jgi:acyl dehydratase
MTQATDEAHFDLDTLGQWIEGDPFRVHGQAIEAYARATNDASPAGLAGELAPPVFAVVPIWDVMAKVTETTVAESVRPLVVHGEMDLWLHEPLRAGDDVEVRVGAVGVHAKSSGTTVVVKAETRAADGRLLNEQYSTQFYRGVTGGPSAGETAPGHAPPAELDGREPDAEMVYAIDDDQTVRYAEASGDHFPIHLSDAEAQRVGLPGRIVHGLCVLAFAGRAALELEGRDVDAVRRLAVRFSRPVFPGARVTTRLWRISGDEGETRLAFDAHTEDGAVVLKDGLIVLAAR